MPDATDTLPPVALDDWQNYQSNQFGQSTDAMLATITPPPPPSSDSLTNPLGTGNAAPPTPPDPTPSLTPDLAPAPSPPADANADTSPPVAPAASSPPPDAALAAPAATSAAPAPVTPTSPLATEDLSPVLNAASAAGVDPAVFLAAHQAGQVDPSNFFDQATQLAGHIKDAGGDLVQGLAAFTGSASNAAKVLDQAVANLHPQPAAPAPSDSSSSSTGAPVDTASLPTQIDSSSHQAFIDSAAPIAQAWAAKTGIPAEYFLAANASESNWGKAPGNELFGIKAPGNAGSQNLVTWEQQGGQHVDQTLGFGAYKTPNDAYQAFVDLISNTPRYANAWQQFQQDHDPAKLFQGLNAAGYATDPNWGSNIASIARSIAPSMPRSSPDTTSSSVTSPPTVADATDRRNADTLSQFGDPQLTTDEAYAACGPAAAVRFAEAEGRNPTLREATDLAASVGWTSASGMAGLSSEKALMDKLDVPTRIVQGAAWDAFAREAQTGNPVTISTAGHYFYADGYNPETGAFHVGQSGLDLRGGSEWMTPAQMTARMGPVQGGLLADNPTIANPSTVTGSAGLTMGANQPADQQDRIDRQTPPSSDSLTNPLGTGNAAAAASSTNQWPSPTAPVTAPLVRPVSQPASDNATLPAAAQPATALTSTGNSTLDWLGQQKDQLASTIGNTAGAVGNAVGNALPTFNPTLDPNSPVAQQAAGNPQNPLAVQEQASSGLADTLVPPGTPVLSGVAHTVLDPKNLAFGPAGYLAGLGSGAAQNVTQQLGGDQTAQTVAGLAGGLVGGVSPQIAERVGPQVLSTGLEALDALRPPETAFASSMSGPQRALVEARQAVADLAARFPQMSPGSLAASSPGKQLAALEADAAANPSKYETLIPNANRARATAADVAAAAEGLPTREARLAANDVNAGAEPPIEGEPFTRDPQGNIVPAPAPQDATLTLQGLINQAKAKGFDTSALEAQIDAMKPPAEAPSNVAAGVPSTPAVASNVADLTAKLDAIGQQIPGYQTPVPEYERISQQSVADVRAQAAQKAAAATPTEPPAPLGTPTTSGPRQVAPVTLDQVAPQGPLSRVTQVVNSAFQPIENLPNGDVKDALKRYAAVVGSQSQGARVVGDTAAHLIAESGPMFTSEGIPVESGAAMQSAVEAKARADLNGVLQTNGLSEKTPEVAAILNNIRNPSAIASNPAGNALLGVNSAIKGSLFGLSNMHNYTEALTAAASGGPEAIGNYARAFLSPSFADGVRYGTMAPDFNQAAMAGVTGLLRSGAGGSDAGAIANVATRAVIGGIGGGGAGYEESLRAGDKQNALRNAAIGAVGGAAAGVAAPALFGSMFGRAVPLAKVTVFKQLTAGGMDDLQAAAAVNRSFGGLNYAQMGRSQTLQDAMRLMMTAPDWNESTVRQIGAAVTGRDSGYSAKMLAKAIAGPMIASELLNYVLTGHSTMQNEAGHQLEVQIGTDKSGKGVYMGLLPGNVQSYGNLIDKLANAPGAAGADLTQFAQGRAGVIPQLGARLSGSEWLGGPKAKNTVASLASTAAPIGIDSTAQGLERGASWQSLAASILAGPNLRYGSKALAATASAPTAPAPAVGRYAAPAQRTKP